MSNLLRKTYVDALKPEIVNSKLEYIYENWVVGKDFLDRLFTSPNYDKIMENVNRATKKRFRKELRSIEICFDCLYRNDIFAIYEKLIMEDKFDALYNLFLLRNLGLKDFTRYTNKEWDDKIIHFVEIAQWRYIKPRKPKAKKNFAFIKNL